MRKKIILCSIVVVFIFCGLSFLIEATHSNSISNIAKESISSNWESNFFRSLIDVLKAMI
jgi:hypothetical protein